MSGEGGPAPALEAARRTARELQRRFEAEGDGFGWFEALYERAGGDSTAIPWAMAPPRLELKRWIEAFGEPRGGGRAVDIGCGLGDNAQLLAAAGWRVTAFDISETAAGWARRRFPDSGVDYRAADLFDLPAAWTGAFDLVHETYNLQAMPRERLAEAMARVASLVAPGGTVLVICRARDSRRAALAAGAPGAGALRGGRPRAGPMGRLFRRPRAPGAPLPGRLPPPGRVTRGACFRVLRDAAFGGSSA